MGTAKICKKFNFHVGFLRADQGRAKYYCQIGWIGCPILQVAQKATMRLQFLAFAIPSSSRHEKRCQMVERLSVVFHHSRNILCCVKRKTPLHLAQDLLVERVFFAMFRKMVCGVGWQLALLGAAKCLSTAKQYLKPSCNL